LRALIGLHLAVVLALALAPTPPALAGSSAMPSDIVNGILQHAEPYLKVRPCIAQSGESPAKYLSHALTLREVTLNSGEHMVVAEGTEGCLAFSESAVYMIFERTPSGYRWVYGSNEDPAEAKVGTDGSLSFIAKAVIEVWDQFVYQWNGTTYEFEPFKSITYDTVLDEKRPYAIAVHFPAGSSTTTVSGTATVNFGNRYAINARAGQRMTVELLSHTGSVPNLSLMYGTETSVADISNGKWEGTLPKTGMYYLSVDTTNPKHDHHHFDRYSLRIATH
jgi:hypothetical protein